MSDMIHTFRHYLATLAFRLKRVTDDAPEGFGDCDAGSGVRTPLEIMHHMSRLLFYAESMFVSGEMPVVEKVIWVKELDRFRDKLIDLDNALLTMEKSDKEILLKALQGPLSDAMTHIGQLATLRRIVGAPIEGISYVKADIQVGVF